MPQRRCWRNRAGIRHRTYCTYVHVYYSLLHIVQSLPCNTAHTNHGLYVCINGRVDTPSLLDRLRCFCRFFLLTPVGDPLWRPFLSSICKPWNQQAPGRAGPPRPCTCAMCAMCSHPPAWSCPVCPVLSALSGPALSCLMPHPTMIDVSLFFFFFTRCCFLFPLGNPLPKPITASPYCI